MDAWIKDAIIDRAYSLRQAYKTLKDREYYSGAPPELIDTLLEVIDWIIQHHKKISKLKVEDIEFKRIGQFLAFLHLFLEEIKTVQVSDVPVELLPFLEQVVKKYDKNALIYLKPTKEYNYTYINNVNYIYEVAKDAFGYEKRVRKKIATISFPISEKNNALLHCIFSHEIGHYFDDIFLIRDKVIPNIQIDKKSLDEIVEIIRRNISQIKREVNGKAVGLDIFYEIGSIRAQQVENFTTILTNWVNELIADTIGTCLFGPCYLFSLVEMSSTMSNDRSYTNVHPPLFIRLIPILRVMEDFGSLNMLRKYEQIYTKINDLKENVSSLSFTEEDDLQSRLLEISIKPVLPKLIDETRKIVKPLYLSTEIEKEIKELTESIKRLTPPNEIVDCENETSYPANPLAILNASWIVRLEYMNDIYKLLNITKIDDKHEARVSLNELTLKALELREIHNDLMVGIKRASSQKKK